MSNKYRPREEEAINTFIKEVYKSNNVENITKIDEATLKRPDYFFEVDGRKTILEIKEIHEFNDNQESARWASVVNGIKEEINKNPKFKNIDGLYSLDSIRNVALPRNKHKKFAEDILNAIEKKSGEVKLNNLVFTIKRFDSDIGDVVFAGFGNVRSVDPPGIILANISKKIITANSQLSITDMGAEKRILLLVNQFYLGSVDDVVKALSKMYSELLLLESIDEIWLQQKDSNTLIYTKDFIGAFEKCQISPINTVHINLFQLWYWSFEDLDGKQLNILDAFKRFFNTNKPYEIFTDQNKRQSMVKFGEYLIKQGDIKNTLWLIDRFFDDPDPMKPTLYKGNPEFNYHKKILEGKDVNVITTVQGHLAWVVKELSRVSDKDHISNLLTAFEYTKNKLSVSNQNLYIVFQWLFPLIEIANRRLWIANLNSEKYLQFRSLILNDESGLIAKYSGYKEIARNLVQLLYYFKDLTSTEAEYVINKLIFSPEIDATLVFFALYRERHYLKGSEAGDIVGKSNPEILNYSSDNIQRILKDALANSEYKNIRSGVSWQFWKILHDQPEEFCHLVDWIDLLFNFPYGKDLYSKLELIIEDWYGKTTKCNNPSNEWLLKYLNKVVEYISNKESGKNIEVWLSIDNILDKVADIHPDDLVEIADKLFCIWMKGAFIGDLNVIFGSYKNVQDKTLRSKLIKHYQDLYIKMKEVNPKITPIIFN